MISKRCRYAAHSQRAILMRRTTNLAAMRFSVVTQSNLESCPPWQSDVANASCSMSNIDDEDDMLRTASTPPSILKSRTPAEKSLVSASSRGTINLEKLS